MLKKKQAGSDELDFRWKLQICKLQISSSLDLTCENGQFVIGEDNFKSAFIYVVHRLSGKFFCYMWKT